MSTAVNLVLGLSRAEPARPAPVGSGVAAPQEDPRVSQVAKDLPIPVSLVALIAEPQVYDGKRVIVRGYLVRGFESETLWLHKEDARYHLSRNGVGVDLPDEGDDTWQGYVAIDGIFDARRTMSNNGSIHSITRILAQSPRQTMDSDSH